MLKTTLHVGAGRASEPGRASREERGADSDTDLRSASRPAGPPGFPGAPISARPSRLRSAGRQARPPKPHGPISEPARHPGGPEGVLPRQACPFRRGSGFRHAAQGRRFCGSHWIPQASAQRGPGTRRAAALWTAFLNKPHAKDLKAEG